MGGEVQGPPASLARPPTLSAGSDLTSPSSGPSPHHPPKPLSTQATAPTVVPLVSLPSAPLMVSPPGQLRAVQGG